MPAYGNPGGEDENFADAQTEQAQPGGEPGAEGKEGAGATATIPKALLAGKDFKPGDEIVLKIDQIHGDEVVVSYAPEKGGKEEDTPEPEGETPPEEPEGAPSGAPDEMASMME